MIWHVLTDGTEYAYARPAFTAMKLRKAALKAGAPREYGKAGPGRDYWIKEIREREAEYVRRAEQAYEEWLPRGRRSLSNLKRQPAPSPRVDDFLFSTPSVDRQMRPSPRKRAKASQRVSM
jgi:hypothetical protein